MEVLAIVGMPEVREGDRLGSLIAGHADLDRADIVVVAQKIVSKAEGRIRDLGSVEPSPRAREEARRLGKDPRLVELILSESRRVVRAERGVLITETRHGWVCANAGIDLSNVPGEDRALLLPDDADASARRIRAEIHADTGIAPAIVVSDSFGRPWRLGQTEVAIGCAGLAPLDDWRGRSDREGRELAATAPAIADHLAAAADLVRDKRSGVPAAVVRGLGQHITEEDGPGAAALRRAEEEDLFR